MYGIIPASLPNELGQFGASDCGGVVVVVGVVVMVVVVTYWWWHRCDDDGGNSLCKDGSCFSFRSSIVKCTICGEDQPLHKHYTKD